MKLLKKLSYILILMLACNGVGYAQDVIHKKGGEKIKCKITQVSPEEITYKRLDEVDGPTYTIDKAKILKVVYQNGRVETYVSNASLNDPELYADQLKRAIKVNFFSPQVGYFQVTYEKNIKPGQCYELDLAILGLGRNITVGQYYESGQYTTAKRGAFGLAVGGGFKYNKLPNFISRGSRYAHVMQGAYIKPNAILGVYKENYVNDLINNGVLKKRTVLYGSLGLDLGKQFVFGEKFLLDIGGSLGYMADTKSRNTGSSFSSEDIFANNFTGTRLGTGAGLMIGFAVKAGILIK